MTQTEADLENTADRLRQLFSNRKSVRHGKRWNPAPRFDKPECWLKAAANCIAEKADPNSFIEAAFRYNTIPGGPFPHMLTGQAAINWYRTYAKSVAPCPSESDSPTGGPRPTMTPIEAELDLEIRHTVRMCLQHGTKDFRSALADECAWYFVDFVRIILLPDEQMIQKFGRSAHAQLTANPELIEILKRRGYCLDWLERFN